MGGVHPRTLPIPAPRLGSCAGTRATAGGPEDFDKSRTDSEDGLRSSRSTFCLSQHLKRRIRRWQTILTANEAHTVRRRSWRSIHEGYPIEVPRHHLFFFLSAPLAPPPPPPTPPPPVRTCGIGGDACRHAGRLSGRGIGQKNEDQAGPWC